MGDILYTLLIKPLELIFELIFAASYDMLPNPAVNLVIMSLAINLLVLPEGHDAPDILRPEELPSAVFNEEHNLTSSADTILHCGISVPVTSDVVKRTEHGTYKGSVTA